MVTEHAAHVCVTVGGTSYLESGTGECAVDGSMVQNGRFSAGTELSVNRLNRELLPTLGRPQRL